jgi:hypothetical protein
MLSDAATNAAIASTLEALNMTLEEATGPSEAAEVHAILMGHVLPERGYTTELLAVSGPSASFVTALNGSVVNVTSNSR